MRAFALAVALAIGLLVSCHPPAEQPPVPPPRPTNPTNQQPIAEAVLDASIISDAGPSLDAIGELESGPPTAR